jgi:beta-phosphoglucomutase-like phosphatase (HAD superfamily)
VKFEVVIFDMDGLMLDTERLAPQAWHDAKEALGVDFDMSLLDAMVGRNYQDCRALILERHGASFPTDRLMDAWHVAYDAIVRATASHHSTASSDLLDWLEQAHIPKAVATSTRRSRAMASSKAPGSRAGSQHSSAATRSPRGKTRARHFLRVPPSVSVRQPASCVVLEDFGRREYAPHWAAGWTPIMGPTSINRLRHPRVGHAGAAVAQRTSGPSRAQQPRMGYRRMIGRLAGTLSRRIPPQILLDVQGVAYEVDVPMSTFYNLPATGER